MRKRLHRRIFTTVGKSAFLFFILSFSFLILLSSPVNAQNKEKETFISIDSTGKNTTTAVVDSSNGQATMKKVRVYSPGKAALRSAILPGLGQVYNKKYWKLPIVYGALGISGGVFAFNLKWYKRTRYAYRVLANQETQNYPKVHKDLQIFITRQDLNTLSYARDQYRRSIDYSALLFVLMWGLNVVDAAVDAHLKAFDVSPDLSFQFKPGYSEMAGTNGLSFVLNIGKKKPAPLPAYF